MRTRPLTLITAWTIGAVLTISGAVQPTSPAAAQSAPTSVCTFDVNISGQTVTTTFDCGATKIVIKQTTTHEEGGNCSEPNPTVEVAPDQIGGSVSNTSTCTGSGQVKAITKMTITGLDGTVLATAELTSQDRATTKATSTSEVSFGPATPPTFTESRRGPRSVVHVTSKVLGGDETPEFDGTSELEVD